MFLKWAFDLFTGTLACWCLSESPPLADPSLLFVECGCFMVEGIRLQVCINYFAGMCADLLVQCICCCICIAFVVSCICICNASPFHLPLHLLFHLHLHCPALLVHPP